jgi:hypothetical protein
MARMALMTGSCPSCGRAVARTVSTHHGLASEAYHCPVHGRRTRSDAGATVADWVAAPPTMVTLGQMLDSVAPPLGGVDWLL